MCLGEREDTARGRAARGGREGGRAGRARTGVTPLPDPDLRDPLLVDRGLGGVQGLRGREIEREGGRVSARERGCRA